MAERRHGWAEPVSYTHLDVYKRQDPAPCAANGAKGPVRRQLGAKAKLFRQAGSKDVYKRQVGTAPVAAVLYFHEGTGMPLQTFHGKFLEAFGFFMGRNAVSYTHLQASGKQRTG